MPAGSLSPLNMQAYAIDPHPRPDGGIEALKVDFDGTGGMFCAFGIKWNWDVNFSQVFGFPLISFEDDAVNDIIGTANGGTGMWNQDSGNGQTWQQLMDSADGQLAVNARFAVVIGGLSVHSIETSTNADFLHKFLIPILQYFHDKYVSAQVDPGPPPGRVPPAVLFPPNNVGMIQSGEGVVGALASLLTITYTQIGAVPVP